MKVDTPYGEFEIVKLAGQRAYALYKPITKQDIGKLEFCITDSARFFRLYLSIDDKFSFYISTLKQFKTEQEVLDALYKVIQWHPDDEISYDEWIPQVGDRVQIRSYEENVKTITDHNEAITNNKNGNESIMSQMMEFCSSVSETTSLLHFRHKPTKLRTIGLKNNDWNWHMDWLIPLDFVPKSKEIKPNRIVKIRKIK